MVGSTFHSSDASCVYQPSQSWGAGVHLYVTLGAASALDAPSHTLEPPGRKAPHAGGDEAGDRHHGQDGDPHVATMLPARRLPTQNVLPIVIEPSGPPEPLIHASRPNQG